MTTASDPRHEHLPFWRTCGEAYRVTAISAGQLVRISWFWLVLTVPVLALINWSQAPDFMAAMDELKAGLKPHLGATFIDGLVVQAAILPMLISITGAWHRLLLRNEKAGSGLYFRFDRIVLSYAAWLILIGLLPAIPRYLATLFGSIGGLMWSAASFAGLFIAIRLFLVLPAKALDHPDVTLGTVWTTTRHNNWRLVGGYLLCILPIGTACTLGAWWLLARSTERMTVTLIGILLALLWMVDWLLSIAFLSLAFRHLVDDRSRAWAGEH